MGLAARGAKILPTEGMSWHWQIVKCTHYERDGGKMREGEKKNLLGILPIASNTIEKP